MKTHVIQLNSNDDFISIREKINWVKAPRILIVWPDSGKIRLLEMEIQLIVLKADKLGAQLAFVCDDPFILQLCKGLGIQVFSSIPEAERKPWRRPKKIRRLIYQNSERKSFDAISDLRSKVTPKKIELKNWHRRILFSIGILAFLIVPGVFIPSANVQLQPKSETQKITIEARANPTITSTNLSGLIPAQIISGIVSLSKGGECTGIIRVPESASQGDVVFRNLTDQTINIPEGVIVRTTRDPIIRFRTNNQISLDPGVNSERIVQVTCLSEGVVGNISAGEIQAIEGEIGGNVLVTNKSAFSGGIETKTFSPSELDYETAKQNLLSEMSEIAFQNFQVEHPEAFLLPRNTLELVKIIQENRFPEIGDPGDRFKLELVAEFSIWEIKQSDILPVMESAILSVSDNKNIVAETDLITTITKAPEFDGSGSLSLTIEATQEMEQVVDKFKVFQLISGKDKNQAILILKDNYDLESNPMIEITPSFWNRLPFLPFRLNLLFGI